MNKYLGKYRGTVFNNADPQNRGRIQAIVPDVLANEPLGWATPCVPYGGPEVGFYMIPPEGASVWVEFEDGDPDYPIWVGCFWDRDEAVPEAPGHSPGDPALKLIKTEAGTIVLNEAEKSITIQTEDGMKIVLDRQKILVDNGQSATIELSGNKVSINGSALEVT
jgi:uncharacterized protein involved in type VI secretion and phage assembly